MIDYILSRKELDSSDAEPEAIKDYAEFLGDVIETYECILDNKNDQCCLYQSLLRSLDEEKDNMIRLDLYLRILRKTSEEIRKMIKQNAENEQT